MKGYRIKTVASATGVSPELLRAWERRYKVVSPTRSPGGYRAYSEQDVLKLRLLRDLTSRGFAISEVASLGVADLERLAEGGHASTQSAPALPTAPPTPADTLVQLATGGDVAGLRQGLRRALAMMPGDDALEAVILPLLREVAWRAERDGDPRARALVAEEIRGFVGPLAPPDPAQRVLVATTGAQPAHVLQVEAAAHVLAEGAAPFLATAEVGGLVDRAEALGAAAVLLCVEGPASALDLRRWPISLPLIVVGASGPVPAGVRAARASFDLPNALAAVLDSEE